MFQAPGFAFGTSPAPAATVGLGDPVPPFAGGLGLTPPTAFGLTGAAFVFGRPDFVIARPFELDAFAVHLSAGVTYTVAVHGAPSRGGTLHDPALLLFDGFGGLLALQDDAFGAGREPVLRFAVARSGDYLLGVTDLDGGTGSYRIELAPSGAVFPF